MSVLLLNASFEPLRVLSLKRAVVLVMQEKAEIIEAAEEPVRSASQEFPRPSVIRLVHYVRLPWNAKVPLNRKTLMARDGHECQVSDCTRAGTTIDHLMPRSRGGKHEWGNVASMCARHNFAKGDRTMDEMGWTLKKEPVVPRRQLLVGFGTIDPAWEPHLAVAG